MVWFNFKNGIYDNRCSDGEALHSVDEPDVPRFASEKLHEQIRSAVGDTRMFSKLFCRRYEHGELHELFELIQVTKMFVGNGKRVKGSNACCFLTFFDRQVVPQSAGYRQFTVYHRKRSTEK